MTIRPYQSADANDLLTVFRKNVPVAFAENEIAEYAVFLQTNTDPYFVAEHSEQIVGACGWYETQDGKAARVCWIFADPDTKGLGVGSALLRHNMALIEEHRGIQVVESQTSQVAYRFFEKFGFKLQYTRPDVWAPGLDLYFMIKSIRRTA